MVHKEYLQSVHLQKRSFVNPWPILRRVSSHPEWGMCVGESPLQRHQRWCPSVPLGPPVTWSEWICSSSVTSISTAILFIQLIPFGPLLYPPPKEFSLLLSSAKLLQSCSFCLTMLTTTQGFKKLPLNQNIQFWNPSTWTMLFPPSQVHWMFLSLSYFNMSWGYTSLSRTLDPPSCVLTLIPLKTSWEHRPLSVQAFCLWTQIRNAEIQTQNWAYNLPPPSLSQMLQPTVTWFTQWKRTYTL